jgi:hypothetical protein
VDASSGAQRAAFTHIAALAHADEQADGEKCAWKGERCYGAGNPNPRRDLDEVEVRFKPADGHFWSTGSWFRISAGLRLFSFQRTRTSGIRTGAVPTHLAAV